MGTEENKAVYRRFIDEVFNRGDFSNLDALLAPGYRIYDVPSARTAGPDAIRASASMFRTAFPDLHIEVTEVIAEGDSIAATARMTGTHRGELLGMAPTGRRVSVTNMTVIHMRDGKLAQSWVKDDFQMRQLQLEPAGAR